VICAYWVVQCIPLLHMKVRWPTVKSKLLNQHYTSKSLTKTLLSRTAAAKTLPLLRVHINDSASHGLAHVVMQAHTENKKNNLCAK